MNILLVVEQLSEDKEYDGRILINLKMCGKCRENIMELFRIPMAEEEGMTFENLLVKIHEDDNSKKKDLKVKFEDFMVMCPSCKDKEEDITFEKIKKEDLDLLNNTPLSKIWLVKSIG